MARYEEFLNDARNALSRGRLVTLRLDLPPQFSSRRTNAHLDGMPAAVTVYVPANLRHLNPEDDNRLFSPPERIMLGGTPIQARQIRMKAQPLEQVYQSLTEALGMKNTAAQPAEAKESKRDTSKARSLPECLTDLTELAREGNLQPVIGRDDEIEEMILILGRKTKACPCLVGDAGVGKTAIVMGAAQVIASGDVPSGFPVRRILQLDLTSLFAGAGHMGEPEKRLKQVLKLAGGNGTALFIDEIHMIREAQGTLSFADSLKPLMATGEIRIIGATTGIEYRRIEADSALARRFTKMEVKEPSPEQTRVILRGIAPDYAAHHGVSVEDAVIARIPELAHCYIPQRRLPDKAIDLLDLGCMVCRTDGDTAVTEHHILRATEKLSGIPLHRLRSDATRLLELPSFLAERIIGQDDAIATLCNMLQTRQTGLSIGQQAFLLIGPTGVGKTETARCIADFLFGTEDALIRLDMSEFQEQHAVAKLLGAPPGYVGYDQGGMLTEAVKRRPYCVVLFDEIEKAHPAGITILLQILDAGRLTDSSGMTVSFKEALVILTSNIPLDQLKQRLLPELLGRLRIVAFKPLSEHDLSEIARKELEELKQRLSGKEVILEYDDSVPGYLASGSDLDYGAREVKRQIETEVIGQLSWLPLDDVSRIALSVDNGIVMHYEGRDTL